MPVLASYVGGIPSLIDHGHTGLMFPAGDEVTLADQIDKIFSGDGLAAALGCAARVVALRRHARDRVLGQLKNAYSVAITGDFQDGDAAAESLAANV
jgi:glycosyltransferase involved in cell wall biosynthesis